jgi:hypothetical protein
VDVKIQTEFGELVPWPDYIDEHIVEWDALDRPFQAEENPSHGTKGNIYYNNDFKFSISKPGDDWYFWRPTTAFKVSMGPLFNVPGRSMPIMILSRRAYDLFRPNISVTVEDVGQQTNIQELIELNLLVPKALGVNAEGDMDVRIGDDSTSGLIGYTTDKFGKTLCIVQHCYHRNGRFYTITATYVPISSENKKPYGGLQEILNSFKLLDA